MRTAITIGFIIVYFAVFAALATKLAQPDGLRYGGGAGDLAELHLPGGVIVVSYFGVTAATEITEIVKGNSGPDGTTANADTNTQ